MLCKDQPDTQFTHSDSGYNKFEIELDFYLFFFTCVRFVFADVTPRQVANR